MQYVSKSRGDKKGDFKGKFLPLDYVGGKLDGTSSIMKFTDEKDVVYRGKNMIDVLSLVSQYGSPLFLLRESDYRDKLREFRNAFCSRYPNCLLAYSFKTNNLAVVIAIAYQEGYGAEVVSEFEYALAERLSIAGSVTVYNGPVKTEQSLERAVQRESIINTDSYPEIELISKVCSRLRKKAHIGVRINVLIGDLPWSKFGFNMENGEALKACAEILKHPYLSLEGVHLHLGTNIINLEWYEEGIKTVARFAKDLYNQLGTEIQFLDLGGGFAASSDAPPYAVIPDDWCVPSINDYAEAICRTLTQEFSPNCPLLILEPGRVLISQAMSLITQIISVKEAPQGKLAIVDAGINLVPSVSYLKHPIKAVKSSSCIKTVGLDIYGPLCTQYDVLGVNIPLPNPNVRDLLEVQEVGAYTLTFSSQFSFPRPAVVLMREDSEITCIQRRESFEDLLQRDLYFETSREQR
jgi:diaminopimelate decarboxylase